LFTKSKKKIKQKKKSSQIEHCRCQCAIDDGTIYELRRSLDYDCAKTGSEFDFDIAEHPVADSLAQIKMQLKAEDRSDAAGKLQ